MTDKNATSETMLPEREQEILDTALLESDQLLARSLHDDQRRRRRQVWLLTLVIGGVAMCALLIAIMMGWLTFGQLQTAEAAKPSLAQVEQAEELSAEGWELWKSRDFSDAAKKFEKSVKLNPKDANAWNGYGWALFNGGQRTKAIGAFEKCIKIAPRHPAGLNGLGQVYLTKGELKKAERYLKKAAPQAPAAWYGLTRINLLKGDFKQAKTWAEKVVKQSPNDDFAQKMLVAAVTENLDDELKAMIEPATNQQASASDEKADDHGTVGSTQGEAEFPGNADEDWKRRLLAVKESDRWNVGAEIGMELVRMPGDRPYNILAENWEQIAVSARKQILKGFTPGMMGNKKIHPRFFDVMHLGMMDKDPGVRGYAATYIEMQGLPNFEHNAKGYLLWRKDNESRTAEEIVKQSKNGATYADDSDLDDSASDEAAKAKADFQRGWKKFFDQKYATAERLFRRVLETEPSNAYAMNGLGWSLHNQGKSEAAKPILEKAIELEPNHWGAVSGLASVHHRLGDVDEAVKLWERVVENSEGPNDASVMLAEIYVERKQFDKAAERYEKLVEWHPEQKEFLRALERVKGRK